MAVEKPVFNGRLVKGTGNGEQIEVVFAAADGEQLRSRLRTAVKVCEERMKANNEQVLELADAVKLKVDQIKETARREVIAELGAPEGGSNGTASGAADVRPDS
jgi:ribosomal protein S20